MPSERAAREAGIDLQDLLVRVDHDLELLREIFELFEKEFPLLFESLTDAVRRGDAKGVQGTAHTLKGMLAGLSFISAASTAKLVEQMAGQPHSQDMQSALSLLQNQVDAARAFLTRICHGVAV